MKFNYQYRTSANELRSGVIDATARDEAYRLLRERGVRPSRVDEAPGLFNKLFGKGKRWMAIVVLSVVVLITASMVVDARRTQAASKPVLVQPRHQIYGEPAFMASLERREYSDVFAHPGERFLARFAQPGGIVKSTSAAERHAIAASFATILSNEIVSTEDERREVAELKAIVRWMKEELRAYLADGVGSFETYVDRLVERQAREHEYFVNVVNEVKKMPDRLTARNEELRRLGLPTVTSEVEEGEN